MKIEQHETEFVVPPPTFTLEVSLTELRLLERAMAHLPGRVAGEVLGSGHHDTVFDAVHEVHNELAEYTTYCEGKYEGT